MDELDVVAVACCFMSLVAVSGVVVMALFMKRDAEHALLFKQIDKYLDRLASADWTRYADDRIKRDAQRLSFVSANMAAGVVPTQEGQEEEYFADA